MTGLMQPSVAVSHLPATPVSGVTDPTGAVAFHRARPMPCPKAVMVQHHISDSLTITSLDWSQVCLRQGCTLLATYKCTLPTFLAQVGVLRTTEEKWSYGLFRGVYHGAV